ncbi:MAG TPA: S1 RNA-binding domain-containing protein, partial [Candidatus Melainabacteria bacterium]|nr:S1 RNA-binding domain-containing protein [Candidatus Melainabacteria bacterium]
MSEQQVEQNPLREEFEKLLEETLQIRYQQGDIVKGGVVRIERDGVLVDVGAKSEGFVPYKEISNMPVDHVDEVVKIGEEYEFYILREENENGQLT